MDIEIYLPTEILEYFEHMGIVPYSENTFIPENVSAIRNISFSDFAKRLETIEDECENPIFMYN